MNTFKYFKLTVLLTVLMLSATLSALAQPYDFKVTNAIAAGAYNGTPTNQVGTNGCAIANGSYISIPNVDKGMLTFTGAQSTSSTSNLMVVLTRSTKSSPPNAFYDFDTTNFYTFTIPMNGTNIVTWSTNLDATVIGAASYLGFIMVSNGAASGYITNSSNGTNAPPPILRFAPKINTATGLKSPG